MSYNILILISNYLLDAKAVKDSENMNGYESSEVENRIRQDDLEGLLSSLEL